MEIKKDVLGSIVNELLYYEFKLEELDGHMVKLGFKSNMGFIPSDAFWGLFKDKKYVTIKYTSDDYILELELHSLSLDSTELNEKNFIIIDVNCIWSSFTNHNLNEIADNLSAIASNSCEIAMHLL